MRTAIVYYSRTKNTERAARILAKELGADLLRIESTIYPEGLKGYARALLHAFRKQAAPIETGEWNLDQYDLVVVGTPVWGSQISAPVYSYLLSNARHIRRAAFFATCGGSGAQKVMRQMANLCGVSPVAELVLTAADFGHSDPTRIKSKIKMFAGNIRYPQTHSQPQAIFQT